MEALKDYYINENSILNSDDSNIDTIAKNGLTEIKIVLNQCIERCDRELYNATIEGYVFEEHVYIRTEAIDYICQNCEYSGQKLLDGTYSNISKINATTLGGGTKLGTSASTLEEVETLKTQYQNAINMIETEIAKLDV